MTSTCSHPSPKVNNTEVFVVISHCGTVYWTEAVGPRDNFAWSGGRHFRVPITDVTQDVQLQVFTLDKTICIGQVSAGSVASDNYYSVFWIFRAHTIGSLW